MKNGVWIAPWRETISPRRAAPSVAETLKVIRDIGVRERWTGNGGLWVLSTVYRLPSTRLLQLHLLDLHARRQVDGEAVLGDGLVDLHVGELVAGDVAVALDVFDL